MNLTNFIAELDEKKPKSNLKVFIEGLALGHFKEGQWKVFFPKAPKHDFKMIVRKRETDTGRLIEENTFELFSRMHPDFFEGG